MGLTPTQRKTMHNLYHLVPNIASLLENMVAVKKSSLTYLKSKMATVKSILEGELKNCHNFVSNAVRNLKVRSTPTFSGKRNTMKWFWKRSEENFSN